MKIKYVSMTLQWNHPMVQLVNLKKIKLIDYVMYMYAGETATESLMRLT